MALSPAEKLEEKNLRDAIEDIDSTVAGLRACIDYFVKKKHQAIQELLEFYQRTGQCKPRVREQNANAAGP